MLWNELVEGKSYAWITERLSRGHRIIYRDLQAKLDVTKKIAELERPLYCPCWLGVLREGIDAIEPDVLFIVSAFESLLRYRNRHQRILG